MTIQVIYFTVLVLSWIALGFLLMCLCATASELKVDAYLEEHPSDDGESETTRTVNHE